MGLQTGQVKILKVCTVGQPTFKIALPAHKRVHVVVSQDGQIQALAKRARHRRFATAAMPRDG